MALKGFERENKFTPLLEWKFYSNLIKTHPCQVFPIRRGNVLSRSAMRGPAPEAEGGSKELPDDRHGGCRVQGQGTALPESLLLQTQSSLCCLLAAGCWLGD